MASLEVVVAHEAIEVARDLVVADVRSLRSLDADALLEQRAVHALDEAIGARAADLGGRQQLGREPDQSDGHRTCKLAVCWYLTGAPSSRIDPAVFGQPRLRRTLTIYLRGKVSMGGRKASATRGRTVAHDWLPGPIHAQQRPTSIKSDVDRTASRSCRRNRVPEAENVDATRLDRYETYTGLPNRNRRSQSSEYAQARICK